MMNPYPIASGILMRNSKKPWAVLLRAYLVTITEKYEEASLQLQAWRFQMLWGSATEEQQSQYKRLFRAYRGHVLGMIGAVRNGMALMPQRENEEHLEAAAALVWELDTFGVSRDHTQEQLFKAEEVIRNDGGLGHGELFIPDCGHRITDAHDLFRLYAGRIEVLFTATYGDSHAPQPVSMNEYIHVDAVREIIEVSLGRRHAPWEGFEEAHQEREQRYGILLAAGALGDGLLRKYPKLKAAQLEVARRGKGSQLAYERLQWTFQNYLERLTEAYGPKIMVQLRAENGRYPNAIEQFQDWVTRVENALLALIAESTTAQKAEADASIRRAGLDATSHDGEPSPVNWTGG
jgi:hypothetical protein